MKNKVSHNFTEYNNKTRIILLDMALNEGLIQKKHI